MAKSHLHHKPHSFCQISLPSFYHVSVTALILLSWCASTKAQSASLTKELYFLENVPPPALIGSMAQDSDSAATTYTVLQANDRVDGTNSPKYSDLFDFQPNGKIYSKVALDREEKSLYTLVVFKSSGVILTVNIHIKDINDNAPSFPDPSVRNLTIPENTRPDDQLSVLGSALDKDAGINSTQRYEIISGSNGVFRLEETQVYPQ